MSLYIAAAQLPQLAWKKDKPRHAKKIMLHMPQTLMSFPVSLCHGKWKTTKPGVTARSCATMPPEPTEVESSQVSFVSSMAATAANMDSNGRLRMASMAMAEVGLERGSDTTHKQSLAATHAHCTAGYSWPRDKAYESLRKSLKVGGKGHGP